MRRESQGSKAKTSPAIRDDVRAERLLGKRANSEADGKAFLHLPLEELRTVSRWCTVGRENLQCHGSPLCRPDAPMRTVGRTSAGIVNGCLYSGRCVEPTLASLGSMLPIRVIDGCLTECGRYSALRKHADQVGTVFS